MREEYQRPMRPRPASTKATTATRIAEVVTTAEFPGVMPWSMIRLNSSGCADEQGVEHEDDQERHHDALVGARVPRIGARGRAAACVGDGGVAAVRPHDRHR
jgi:hypothetical protein